MSAMGRSKARAARALAVAALTVCVALFTIAPPANADLFNDLFGWLRPTTTTTAPGGGPPPARNWLLCLLGGCPPPTTTPPGSPPPARNWLLCLLGGCRPTTTTSSTSSTTTTTTTTTIPTTTTTPPTESCDTLPRAGGGTWECSFNDEFDGTSLDRTKWTPELTADGRHDGGHECFVDDPDNISVSDGSLRLTVRKEAAPIECASAGSSDYTSGMVSTVPGPGVGFAQTYGRYEIRARVTGAKVKGLQEAFWMYPVTPIASWPASGEIDIAEIYHQNPDRAIPYVHYNNWTDPNVTNNYCLIDDISKFHTYVLEWTPQSIKIIYDGNVCIDDPWQPFFPQSGRQPFDQPFYLILTQALGIGSNAFDPVNTPLPASTVVDYVRIWE